jgi:hypothetical protein
VRGILIRVGVDQAFGGWNAPVDPDSLDFAYVPIPEGPQRRGLETCYSAMVPALSRFPGICLPSSLATRATHLDPDFEYLTYGDNSVRRGRAIADFKKDDFLVFFAGLRPAGAWADPLLYAVIGFYCVQQCVRLSEIPRERWRENAHTRRTEHRPTDIIIRAEPGVSGRLRRCIVIGEWRDRAYRVRRDILKHWGGISCRNGYIQRSAVPPTLLHPERFLSWFQRHNPELLATNNPSE